ncbi:MAG: DUF1572 domain-containing protein [Winogradskyella sp.]|uniref:DUF1572 domain-containing protein n=1 Tax=Winogradskyella sp. TaxID=1883156 RepID=UPI000F41A502|nr:DUF1572 domain-containing protein [Winogradskyella sp.]RNC86820.1 MAG: DUF1572 domain-containing protein [Winogradskyella sp.]
MTHINNLESALKQLYFGGNWTGTNVKDSIQDINLLMATKQIEGFNTIAKLVFHINYYVEGILPVFDGGILEIRDKFSFDAPQFNSEEDWNNFKLKVLKNAELLIEKVNALDDDILHQPFVDEKYGNYYRNLNGIIEHTHYHLGQIVILKKFIQNNV